MKKLVLELIINMIMKNLEIRRVKIKMITKMAVEKIKIKNENRDKNRNIKEYRVS